MKKIFTLICMVLGAMSVNAQEVYKSYVIETNDDGSEKYVLASEFKAVVGEDGKTANNVENNKSVVKFSTANVDGEAVGSGTPKNVEGGQDITPEGVVNSWNSIEWQVNKNRIVKDENGTIIGRAINVSGSGVAYTGISAVQASKDGEPIEGVYKASYTYYITDGSLGMPVSGLYYKFTPKVNGTLKVAIWSNKDNRKTFVVEEASKLPVAYTAEGYVNSNTYSSPEEVQTIHNSKWVGEDGVDSNPYVIGNGTQFWGYITFDVEANKTYWAFQETSQLGFGGYEFTAGGAGINDIKNDVDKNAPSYNLAGQRVDDNYKGVVIKNGKKVVKK